ncbi:hypothetical protein RKD26_005319 [Streptomyces calvus]
MTLALTSLICSVLYATFAAGAAAASLVVVVEASLGTAEKPMAAAPRAATPAAAILW